MTRRVGLGLIGCGSVAYWIHLRALRRLRGATLVAASDPDPDARERARRLARVPVYQRADELLGRDDVAAIVICAPSDRHADLAIAASAAGKHFYLEKPIATSLEDAGRVIEAAAQAGAIGVIGFNRRLHPLYQRAREVLAEGRIGPVRAVQTSFCEPIAPNAMPQWKRRRETGGGVLLDLASHHFDQLRWLLADDVASVSASLLSELSEGDTARVELAMCGGAAVQSFFSFRAGLCDRLYFIGERGTLLIDRHSGALSLRLGRRLGYGVRPGWIAPTAGLTRWRVGRLLQPSVDPSYRQSLDAFVALLQGQPAGSASLGDGVRSLEIVLAAEESARRGERVSLSPSPSSVPVPACASS